MINFDIIYALTQKELKVRYKNNFFGYFWSIANPLAYAFVYFIIFKMVMKTKTENFPIFLITGLFPWQWLSNSISSGAMTFIGNAQLIKRVHFPRNTLSFVVVLQDMIHFLASIPVIILFSLIFNVNITWQWFLGIPVIAFVQLLMAYSLNLLTATINLFFRDLEKLIQIAITFLFYFTPIVYDYTMIPIKYQPYIILNPVAPIIMTWRILFLKGEINFYFLGIATGWALLTFLLAEVIYRKLCWRFAEIL